MIIVMLGKLRSGKTTVADILIDGFSSKGIDLVKKPLAKPIYDEAKNFYKRNGLTWRKNRRLMEGIGEAFNEDYPGGDKLVELYQKDFNPNDNIVIEDCRRLTQTDFFEKHNSFFIRVESDVESRKERCKPGEWCEGHVSDNELDDYKCHFTVFNNGSMNDLIIKTMYLIECIYGRYYGKKA